MEKFIASLAWVEAQNPHLKSSTTNNQPTALISNKRNGEVLQIHKDHLGTPRAVSDKDNTTVWRWEGDA